MSGKLRFRCDFCGKDFGEHVMELAKHIGRSHDPVRRQARRGQIRDPARQKTE